MTGLSARLQAIAAARRLIAAHAEEFAAAAARPGASAADILVAEVLPLLAACRFLERNAARLLRPRRPGGRPIWLFGTRLLVRRVPLGRVLVIGPANYPLFLPGVQALQALAAGNTVLVKPAPGCAAPMHMLARRVREAGLTLTILDDTVQAAQDAMAAGVDHVVLTGSGPSGRAVLAALAPLGVPATMELSGRDPMVVLEGADLALAAQAAVFGLALNAGRTCIAPRRIIVVDAVAEAFGGELQARLAACAPVPMAAQWRDAIGQITGQAVAAAQPPVVVSAAVQAEWVQRDIFASVAALHTVADESAAIEAANAGPTALGATVFGPSETALRVAARLRAGCVVVNDMIAPTAHPALPFGGSGASGFGVTRGAEGLLAMTRPQAVVERTLRSTRHMTRLPDSAAPLVASLLRLAYGRWTMALLHELWSIARGRATGRRTRGDRA